MTGLPVASEVRTIVDLIDCIDALRNNAVSGANFHVAVMWRAMREAVVGYNDLEAFEATKFTKSLAINLRIVAEIMERITDNQPQRKDG